MKDVSQQISPLCNLIKLRRFDDYTLRTLQLILESKDSMLLLQLRNSLKEFLRSESLIAIHQLANKPIAYVLSVLDFFVRAFAVVVDVESCLALRYEALVLREARAISHPELQVSCTEWVKFAEDAFDSGFYSIASKASENALLHLDIEDDAKSDNLCQNRALINKIQSLKDVAIRLSAGNAVQIQALEHLKCKKLSSKQSSLCNRASYPASMSFRNGIKQKNMQKLLHLQNINHNQGA